MRQLRLMPLLVSNPIAPSVPAAPRPRLGKLCVALQAATPAELWERAEAALADARFLEFRLDALAKPAAALEGLKDFLMLPADLLVYPEKT